MAINPMKIMSFAYELMDKDTEWSAIGSDFISGIGKILTDNPNIQNELLNLIDSVMPRIDAIAAPNGKVIEFVDKLKISITNTRNPSNNV